MRERCRSCSSAGGISDLWTMWLSVATTQHDHYQGIANSIGLSEPCTVSDISECLLLLLFLWQGSILLWTHTLRPFYSRPIALNQEGRSLVNDVCKCVRHWRVREGWVGVSNFLRYLERTSSGCGLLSGLGPIDWRLLFNVNGPSQVYHFSQHQRSWHLDAANQDASNGHIL